VTWKINEGDTRTRVPASASPGRRLSSCSSLSSGTVSFEDLLKYERAVILWPSGLVGLCRAMAHDVEEISCT